MKRKIIIAICCLIIAICVGGCGADYEESDSESTKAENNIEPEEIQEEKEGRIVSVTADAMDQYIKLGQYKGVAVQVEMQDGIDEESAKDAALGKAWETVMNGCQVLQYPQEDINDAMRLFDDKLNEYAEQQNMKPEDFLMAQEMTREEFDKQSRDYAEYTVGQNLIVQAIMDAENFKLDDEMSQKARVNLAANYGVDDISDLVEEFGQDTVNQSIAFTRVADFILDNAQVEWVQGEGSEVETAEEIVEEESFSGKLEITNVNIGQDRIILTVSNGMLEDIRDLQISMLAWDSRGFPCNEFFTWDKGSKAYTYSAEEGFLSGWHQGYMDFVTFENVNLAIGETRDLEIFLKDNVDISQYQIYFWKYSTYEGNEYKVSKEEKDYIKTIEGQRMQY